MDGYPNGGGEQARAKMVAPPPGFKNKWNEQTKEWDHIPRDVPVNHVGAGSGSVGQSKPVESGRGGGGSGPGELTTFPRGASFLPSAPGET